MNRRIFGLARTALAGLVTALIAANGLAQSVPDDVLITLERTTCFGTCPKYKVTIDAKGNVTFDGEKFVKAEGRQTDRIPVARVAELLATADRIKFFDLEDKYTALVTDLPTTFVTITRGGRTKRIMDYYGAPGGLHQLEAQIDEAAGTKRWIGSGVPSISK